MKLRDYQSRSGISKSFAALLIGILLSSSTVTAVTNLQSSLNVVDGLGVASLAVFSAGLFVGIVILAPLLQKFFSAKSTLILVDFLTLFYLLANIHATPFSLMLGALLGGLGRGLCWPCCTDIIIFHSKMLVKCGKENYGYYFSNLNAYFCGAFMSSQILGNIFPILVFKLISPAIDQKINDRKDNELTILPPYFNQTLQSNTSSVTKQTYEIKDICGANDCQDPVIVNKYMSNYQPPNELSVYILMGILIATQIIATLFHALFSPSHSDMESSLCNLEENASTEENKNNPFLQTCTEDDEKKDIEEIKLTKQICSGCDKKPASVSVDCEKINEDCEDTQVVDPKIQKLMRKIRTSSSWLKDNLKFFFQPGQLLLIGISFYIGMVLSFAMGEVTRAYIACVFGLAEIGLAMTLYGSVSLIFSVATGYALATFGRPVCVAIATILTYALQLFYILWVPNENSNIGIIYGALIFAGITDTMMLSIVAEVQRMHFPNAGSKPTTSWVSWSGVGYIVQYSWSTSVCVKYKVYAMAGVLTFSVITYSIAEYRHKMKLKNETKSSATDQQFDETCKF